MNKSAFLFLIIIFCWSCSSNSTTEKYQGKRDNIINVRDKIKEIVIEDLLINSYSFPLIIDNYFFEIFKEVYSHLPIGEALDIIKEKCNPIIEKIETSISLNLKEVFFDDF